jgi:hypothetical protein
MTELPEILEPQWQSKEQAAVVFNRAQKHWTTGQAAMIQIMADLRILQDGGIHLLYGERNFATWAEQAFDGLSATNVKQLTRCGGVALELQRHGRLNLEKPVGVNGRGLRELSTVLKTFGLDVMLRAFDAARTASDRDVNDDRVRAVMQLLIQSPATELEIPAALPGADDEEEEEDDDPWSETINDELQETIEKIRDYLYELETDDPIIFDRTLRELRGDLERLEKFRPKP